MALLVEAVVFLLATAMAVSAGVRISEPYGISPWLMPLVVGTVTAVVAAILLLSEIRQRLTVVNGQPTTATAPTAYAGIGVWLLVTTIYAVATPIVGFEWSTVVFLAVALRTFGNASILTTLAIVVAVAGALPFIFRYVFHAIVP